MRKTNSLVGLENPSNHCFANVCIQICFYLKELRQYFCNGEYCSHVAPTRVQRLTHFLLPLFKALQVKNGPDVSVRRLLSVFNDSDLLNGFIHHDSYEFLLRLLDSMDEDLNAFPAELVKHSDETINPLRKETESNWNKFCERSSVVKCLFYGIECSISTCLNCSHVYYTTEPNIGYSVALPQRLVTLCFIESDISSTPCVIQLAVQMTTEGSLLAENIVYQLALRLNISCSKIVLCKLNDKALKVLSLADQISDGASLIAYELKEPSEVICAEIYVSSKIMDLDKHCSYCKNDAAELRKCSACLESRYCSKQCQLSDWQESHRSNCKPSAFSGYVKLSVPLLIPVQTNHLEKQSLGSFKRYLLTCLVPKYLEVEECALEEVLNGSQPIGDSELFHDVECDRNETEFEKCEKENDISCQQGMQTWAEIEDFNCYGICVPLHLEGNKLCTAHSNRTVNSDCIAAEGRLEMNIFATALSLDENHNPCKTKEQKMFMEEALNEESWPSFIRKIKNDENRKTLRITAVLLLSEGKPSIIAKRTECAMVLNERHLKQTLGVETCTHTTLTQCLYAYFAPVKVSGRDCDNCHVKCDAIKRPYIWNLPHYLFVHFKRAAEFRFFSKLSTKVDFQLDSLDMTPFIANGHPSKSTGSNTYRLHSVVQHHGSLQLHGHYTCYIRVPIEQECDDSEVSSAKSLRDSEDGITHRWYHFDDEEIKAVQERDVKSAEPYFLVYERENDEKRLNILPSFNEKQDKEE